MSVDCQLGVVNLLAFSFIEEDLLVMNDELDPMDVLDFLQDGDNFKRVADLLRETMIIAKIPADTKKVLKGYPTINSFLNDLKTRKIDVLVLNESDPTDSFINALLSLLSKQEDECLHRKRKYSWNRPTITRWFSKNGTSESIRSREDAIAICYALGLDYPTSRDFLNRSGHAIFNIRNQEDAVYIYCLTNHRPFSVAKELIHKSSERTASFHISEEESITHAGNTTILLANQILGNSNWESDDDFFNSFLLPNMANFISYSRTALREYYKIKNPIYLLALTTLVSYEIEKDDNAGVGFNKRKIQEYIHKAQKDRDITIPMSSVQVTYNFVNKLRKYADSSALLKEAYDMLDVHVERIVEKGWKEEDFKTVNNSLDVIDYIIRNYSMYSNNEKEQETISDFLTDTVTAYKMLSIWLPSVVTDDEDGNKYVQEYIDADGRIKKRIQTKDKRQRAYNQSALSDTVLSSFPHRNFFTLFEKHPEKLIHDITIRKAIILLFYMNYARNLIQEISNPNATEEETAFGFDNFYKSMNTILGNCQLGKLYYANPFDWLILESIKKLETYNDEDDLENPVSFLDKVLSFSFDPEDEDNG